MDPDEALKQIREKMSRLQDIIDEEKDPSSKHICEEEDIKEFEELQNEIVDLWNGLDRWMSIAGALPDAWAKGR